MSQVLAIAKNTFREAVRNRILYIILLFALIMVGASGVLSKLTISDHEKIFKTLGFAAINLFGVAIAVFVGVSMVYNELEKKTIYTIVSKPISRMQFILGKFLGLLVTIFVNVVFMSFCFLALIHFEYLKVQPDATPLGSLGGALGAAAKDFVVWNGNEITAGVMPVVAATMTELMIVTLTRGNSHPLRFHRKTKPTKTRKTFMLSSLLD